MGFQRTRDAIGPPSTLTTESMKQVAETRISFRISFVVNSQVQMSLNSARAAGGFCTLANWRTNGK